MDPCILDLPGLLVYYKLYTVDEGGMSAVLHRDMTLGPIRPTPSSLLSSSNMAILWRPYF